MEMRTVLAVVVLGCCLSCASSCNLLDISLLPSEEKQVLLRLQAKNITLCDHTGFDKALPDENCIHFSTISRDGETGKCEAHHPSIPSEILRYSHEEAALPAEVCWEKANQCSKKFETRLCQNLEGCAIATTNLSIPLDDILEEIKQLPCFRFLMAQGPVAIEVLQSKVLKTMTNVESLIATVDGTFLDSSFSCEETGCPVLSSISMPPSLQSLDISIQQATPEVKLTSEVRTTLMPLPESLKFLSIRGTEIGGELPSQLPPGLQKITLRDNRFTGQIPKQWGKLSELVALVIWEAAMDNRVEFNEVGWESLTSFDLRFGEGSIQDLMGNSTAEFRQTLCAASHISSDLVTLLAVRPMDCLEFLSEGDVELVEWMNKAVPSKVLWTISSTLRSPETACRQLEVDIDSPLGSFPFTGAEEGCSMVAGPSKCKNCAKILGLHIFDLEQAKIVMESGVLPLIEKLPCLQTLEIGPELMQPSSSISTIEIPPALSTVNKKTLCIFGLLVENFSVPSNVENLAISGSKISNEEEYKALLELPDSLKHLRLEHSGYGGRLPENLPSTVEWIGLRGNQFTGSIPVQWSNAPNLKSLTVIEEENLSKKVPGGLARLSSLSGGDTCDFSSCGYICGQKRGSLEFLETNFDFLIDYLVENGCQSGSILTCGENIVRWSCKGYSQEEAQFVAMLNLYNPIAYPSFSFFYGMTSQTDTCAPGSDTERISWIRLMGPTWIKYEGGIQTLKKLPCLKDLDLEFANSNGPDVDSGLLDRLEVLENVSKLTIRCDGISLWNVSALPRNLVELHTFGIGFIPGAFKHAPSKLKILEIFHGSSLPESWGKLVALKNFTFRATDLYILLPPIFGGMRNLEHLDVCTDSYGDMVQDLVLDTKIQLCRVPGEVYLCGQRLEEVENCSMLFGLILGMLWGPFICLVVLMGALLTCEGCKNMLAEVQSSYVFYVLIPALVFVGDIAIDLTLIGMLWASASSYTMLGIFVVHYVVSMGFFGWYLEKSAAEKARDEQGSIVGTEPGLLDAWFYAGWLDNRVGRVAKVILVLPLGSILVDILSFVSALTGGSLNSLTSGMDLGSYFHARIMIESSVEAPLQAIFQSVAFWLSSRGVLWFDVTVRLFILSVVVSFVSILAGVVKFGCKRLGNLSGSEIAPRLYGNGSHVDGDEVTEPLLTN